MRSKLLIASIFIFLLLLSFGSYFVYQVVSVDETAEKENPNLSENKNNPNKVNPNSSSQSPNNRVNIDSPEKTKDNKVVNNSSSGGESKNPSSISTRDKNNHEVVVDQTIHSKPNNVEATRIETFENTVEAEKVELEITLFDAQENKILPEYDVNATCEYRNGYTKSEAFRTDKNGKFNFTKARAGSMFLQLNTVDFSTHTRVMTIRFGKNEYKAKLLKGGTLEIKATNPENKIVKGLTAKFNTGFRAPTEKDSIPLGFDVSKNVYVLNNVPLGSQDISFKAPGYLETEYYKVRVDAKTTSTLDVRLAGTKVLFFDLDIKTKPDLIYITNLKVAKTAVRTPDQIKSDRLPSRNSNYVVLPSLEVFSQQRFEVFKNQNALFEFELIEKNIASLTLEVEGFASKEIMIQANKDTYKVTLLEGFSGKIIVNNDKGTPVIGATVTYSSGLLNQVVVSDDKGVALLTGMTESMLLKIIVTHPSYVTLNDKWDFDANERNSKTVVLKAGKGVSGTVSFEKKGVGAAKVTLFQSGKPIPIDTMTTGADGSYFFNKIEGKSDITYTVSAYQGDFGVATSPPFSIAEKGLVVNLELVKEKSITVKLVDNKDAPLANKSVTVTNDTNSEYTFNVTTDENGMAELFNLNRGAYTVTLEDSKYRCNAVKTNIPVAEVKLVARKKNLKKVNITVAGGKAFSGELKVTLERNDWPIEVTVDEEGYFVEFTDSIVFVIVVFHAQGYGNVRLGPYQRAENFPGEFNVSFQPGENFKVKVVDDADNQPIPFVTVDISEDQTKIEALPTNEAGEINFSHLGGKFVVAIKEDSYAPYMGEFDGSQTKEIVVRLIKGGGVKGHLTLSKTVSKAKILLLPGTENVTLDAEGNFEFINILPGEYSISVSRTFKDGKAQVEKIPARVIVEREKIFEINLDDFQKNQTTLEVSIIKNGTASNERGFLNITDRRGQSVVATEITNGAYLVERIMPGDYLISYLFQGKSMQKNLAILPRVTNTVEIIVPGSSLTFAVKNAEGFAIPKVMVTLYSGEKFKQEDTYLGNQMITNPQGTGTFFLMPKTPYYFIVEEDFRFNYQVNFVGPIILEAGQDSRIDFVLPYARKLPKLQVIDTAGKALADVGFLFTDETGNFFQRTLLKEWDFFPYSNVTGFMPDNCWPLTNFNLVVGKEGYEFKEIPITADYDPNQLMQIKLNKGSGLVCNFPQKLSMPISVGILNSNGVLLQKPIPFSSRKVNDLTVYYENVSSGSIKFNDLTAGTYFIGYFWNGSTRLISKQGPFTIGVGEVQTVASTLQLEEF